MCSSDLPAGARFDEIADLELCVPGFDDFTDGGADHDLTDHGAGSVGLAVVHAAAHVGIEREKMIAHDEFAVAGLRNIGFDKFEVAFADGALRTRGEQNLFVFHLIVSTVVINKHFVAPAEAGAQIATSGCATLYGFPLSRE